MSCRKVSTVTISSPVGDWIAEACSTGLHSLKLASSVDNDNFLSQGKREVAPHGNWEGNSHTRGLLNWMKAYFADEKTSRSFPTLEICPQVSGLSGNEQNFRQKVWVTLADRIPFGETISYGRLAELCGNPGASRAVGSAMSNNPISLVVPCHRVVKQDGSPGSYSKAHRAVALSKLSFQVTEEASKSFCNFYGIRL